MLIEDVKRIKKISKKVDYFDLHPKEQAEVDREFARWDLQKHNTADLIRELWRRRTDEDYIIGALYALDAMADANTTRTDIEVEFGEI